MQRSIVLVLPILMPAMAGCSSGGKVVGSIEGAHEEADGDYAFNTKDKYVQGTNDFVYLSWQSKNGPGDDIEIQLDLDTTQFYLQEQGTTTTLSIDRDANLGFVRGFDVVSLGSDRPYRSDLLDITINTTFVDHQGGRISLTFDAFVCDGIPEGIDPGGACGVAHGAINLRGIRVKDRVEPFNEDVL